MGQEACVRALARGLPTCMGHAVRQAPYSSEFQGSIARYRSTQRQQALALRGTVRAKYDGFDSKAAEDLTVKHATWIYNR